MGSSPSSLVRSYVISSTFVAIRSRYVIYRSAAVNRAYSSVVEQYTDNVKVGGSNPPRLT